MKGKGGSTRKGKVSSLCLVVFLVVVLVCTVSFVQLAYHHQQSHDGHQAEEKIASLNEKIKEAFEKNQRLVGAPTVFTLHSLTKSR